MKKTVRFVLGFALLASHATRGAVAGGPAQEPQRVTLYSPVKYRNDHSRSHFSFKKGALVGRGESSDLSYGTLYAGENLDWFDTAGGGLDSRSLIRDLGAHAWGDHLTVPVVEPLPKLKEGERRVVTIDASGANGRPGTPGANGAQGADGARGAEGRPGWSNEPAQRGTTDAGAWPTPPTPPTPATPRREPTASPLFVKAVAGHMYVIHVVNNESDYYALFRVDELERGDHCTITWAVVPAPGAQARGK
jgi:hypothetical protein